MRVEPEPALSRQLPFTCPSVPNASSRTSPKAPWFLVRSMSPASFHSGTQDRSAHPACVSSCNSSLPAGVELRSGEIPHRQPGLPNEATAITPTSRSPRVLDWPRDRLVEHSSRSLPGTSRRRRCPGPSSRSRRRRDGRRSIAPASRHLMRHQGLDAASFRGCRSPGRTRRGLQPRVGQPERRHAQRQEPASPVLRPGLGVGHRPAGVPVDDARLK